MTDRSLDFPSFLDKYSDLTWGSRAKHCPDSRQQSKASPCQLLTPHPQMYILSYIFYGMLGIYFHEKKIFLCALKLGIRKLFCNYLTKHNIFI